MSGHPRTPNFKFTEGPTSFGLIQHQFNIFMIRREGFRALHPNPGHRLHSLLGSIVIRHVGTPYLKFEIHGSLSQTNPRG